MRSPARLAAIASIALAACTAPLAAQQTVDAPSHIDGNRARIQIHSRLVVESRRDAREMDSTTLRSVAAARPRWRYPAIGAGVGLLAGIVHAHAMTRGDYVGLPAEPMYVLPPLYAAAGAFVGVLIDSADRERKARRD
jgi:hypothetical protein